MMRCRLNTQKNPNDYNPILNDKRQWHMCILSVSNIATLDDWMNLVICNKILQFYKIILSKSDWI